MAADIHTTRQPSVGERIETVRGSLMGADWLSRLTSIPVLVVTFAVVTLFAAGPFQQLDARMNQRWLVDYAPGLEPFFQDVLDRVAGQAVCLPVLLLAAIIAAYKSGSWRPLIIAGVAEIAFYVGIGGLKALLARPAPVMGQTEFFTGGLFGFEGRGISYPSGHAAEAVLIYGAAAYLLIRYSAEGSRLATVLRWAVVLIAINSVVTSFLLGWHWASDLVAGIIAGGMALRTVVWLDRRVLPYADTPAVTEVQAGLDDSEPADEVPAPNDPRVDDSSNSPVELAHADRQRLDAVRRTPQRSLGETGMREDGTPDSLSA